MFMESFWRKHANDSDWTSRYIDLDRASALTDFTANVVGTGTASLGKNGLVLVNSAGASDNMQYQYTNPTIQVRAPKTPSANGLHPGSYPYEMEFIMKGSIPNPASLSLYAGFCSTDATILAGHSDSIGLVSLGGSAALGLDSWASSVNQLTNYPAGTPNPNAFSYLPADGLQHELAFQVTPLSGTGNAGEFKVWLDGEMLADFGLADQLYWVGLTTALLSPAFALGNVSGSLTAAQRTVTLSGIGWAVRS